MQVNIDRIRQIYAVLERRLQHHAMGLPGSVTQGCTDRHVIR